jgi:hypothetical protein
VLEVAEREVMESSVARVHAPVQFLNCTLCVLGASQGRFRRRGKRVFG